MGARRPKEVLVPGEGSGTLTLVLTRQHFHEHLQMEGSFITIFTLSELQVPIWETGTMTPFRFLLTQLGISDMDIGGSPAGWCTLIWGM